ncbi:MAG: lytic murein transglycosylase [Syntrophorhabdus sp. PtaB.Bin006]|nr:MAG: lytic murein transglycosylase [Syntrophorhabdus sp. PtaB.Bin006]
MVLLCFTFVSVRPTSVAHRERVKKEVKKEEIVPQIISHVQDQNVNLEEDELKTIAEMVYDESVKCNVDYRLVLAIMKVESNFKQNAVSEKGARGLLQVKPSLAKYIASDAGVKWRGYKTLDEPDKNIKIGVRFFSKLVEDFDENINMALHAYHVGPTRLRAILTEKRKPQKRYLNLVLDEYERNRTTLPPP